MELSDKHKMLGFALKARGFSPQQILNIMMIIETDDQIDDLTWYMSQNPYATADELTAVAAQLVKDSEDN